MKKKYLKIYSHIIKLKEIEEFRNKYELRPFIYRTQNQIDNLYISFNIENEIYNNKYNKNIFFFVNNVYGISYFNDNNPKKKKFLNLENGIQFCFKLKNVVLKYSLGTINISTNKPFIIFNDNISINYNDFGFQLTHYSDWFLTENKGYDVPYNLVIPIKAI